MALARTAPSTELEREQEQEPGYVARTVEAARGQCCERLDAEDMKTRRVVHSGQNAGVEDGAGMDVAGVQ